MKYTNIQALSILLFTCCVAIIDAIATNQTSTRLRSRVRSWCSHSPRSHPIYLASSISNVKYFLILQVEPLLHQGYENASKGQNLSGPWPVCLGLDCDDCIDIIKSQAMDIQTFQKVYPGMVVTMDYVINRVRLNVDWDCIVTRSPMRG